MLSLSKKENSNKNEVKVIDDDLHLSNIEKIIVRDFYPDLPKLQRQVQFIEAFDKNDTQRLSELRSKVIKSTPSEYETPKSVHQTPTSKPSSELSHQVDVSSLNGDSALSKREEAKIEKMALNDYMAQYTSEDNANLVEMVEETRIKRQAAKQGYQDRQLAIGESSKEKFWDYVHKNAVMYTPEGVDLAPAEKLELSQTKNQMVDLANTRFRGPIFNTQKPTDLKYHPLHIEGKIGLDGKEIMPSCTPNVKGYKFMGTPSPAPGVDASPLMTWGEIDSTPFRLDGSETPGSGPSFKIPEMSKKDRILHELAGKVGKEKKAKKAEALKQAAKTFARTPRSSMSTTERLQSMSPAAQRIASEKLKLGYDKYLQASYSPSPRHDSSRVTTPSFKSPRTPGSHTPKMASKRKSEEHTLLTDNLLKLPKPNGPGKCIKASDFF